MIILEGPDGGGKTRLAGVLKDLFDLELQPRAVTPDAKAMVPIGEYIERELAKKFGMRLYDRFALISSPMYRPLPNPTFVDPMTNLDWLTAQYQKLWKIDPVIIFCMPAREVVRANVMADTDNDVVQEHIDHIYDNYLAFIAREFSMSWMIWDYTNPTMHRVDALMRWAKARVAKGRI